MPMTSWVETRLRQAAAIQHHLSPGGVGLKIGDGVCIFNGNDPGDGIGGMIEKRIGGPDRQTRQYDGRRQCQPPDHWPELSLRVS